MAESIVNLALYPLDTCKSLAQMNYAFTPRFISGLPRLYAGAAAAVPGYMVDAAVFSFLYVTLRNFFTPKRSHPPNTSLSPAVPRAPSSTPLFATASAAALATLASTLAEAPFALASDRVRLGLHAHPLSAWHFILASRGWPGLFTGAAESVIRDVPFEAAEFGTFQVLSSVYSRIKSHVQPFDTLLLGIATGACVGAALAPLDFVVTRCMAEPTRYRGVLNTITKVAREEGVHAVFKGLGHKVAREAASSALFFTVFDNMQRGSHSTTP